MTSITFICFSALMLTAMYVSRRPLCIESKVVERIDRLLSNSSESIYRCAINKSVPYTEYFGENSHEISLKIYTIERFLENIEPFKRKVRIVVLDDRPTLFRIIDHQIYIGRELFEAEGFVQKAVVKVWYHERSDMLFVNQALLEEVVTDLLMFSSNGQLNIQDPRLHQFVQLDEEKWPTAVKSIDGYCLSPWRLAEHIAACEQRIAVNSNLSESTVAFKNVSTEFSLRPFITSAWIASFKKMSVGEQMQFVQSIPKLLRENHSPDLPLTHTANAVSFPNSIFSLAAESIKNVNSFVATSEMNSLGSMQKFIVNMNAFLQKKGFKDAISEASFDYLFVNDEHIDTKSENFKKILKLADSNPNKHFAIKDAESIWLLPNREALPASAIENIKANNTIYEKCGSYGFEWILSLAKMTDKLLVVSRCNQNEVIDYSAYVKGGASQFGLANRQRAFVQYHLPSLLSKKDKLISVANVYDLIQKREVENPSFQSLGWQEIKWDEQAQAYKPKAYIDGIEWFRSPVVN